MFGTLVPIGGGLTPAPIYVLESIAGRGGGVAGIWSARGRRERQSSGSSRRQDRSGDICSHAEARRVLLPYLNLPSGFTPILPSVTPRDLTVTDLVTFAGVTQP